MENIQNYGVTGNGTTDDTAAAQAAFATGKDFYFPDTQGGYLISDSLTTLPGQKIVGQHQTKIIHKGSNWLFNVTGAGFFSENFIVDGTCNTGVGTGVYNLRSDLNVMDDCEIRNIKTINEQCIITDNPSTINTLNNLRIDNIRALQHRGQSLNLLVTKRNLIVSNILTDFGNSVNPNFPAIILGGASLGSLISHIAVNGSNNALMTNQFGIILTQGGECYSFDNIDVQHCGNYGMWLQSAISIRLTNCNLQLNGAATGATSQLQMDQTLYSQFSNCIFRGCSPGQNYTNNFGYGVTMNGGGNNVFTGCDFKSNGAGFYQAYNPALTYPGGNVVLSGCSFSVNHYHGFIGDNNCSSIIDGAICVYNGTDDFFFNGTNHFVMNAIKSNGTFLQYATGIGAH